MMMMMSSRTTAVVSRSKPSKSVTATSSTAMIPAGSEEKEEEDPEEKQAVGWMTMTRRWWGKPIMKQQQPRKRARFVVVFAFAAVLVVLCLAGGANNEEPNGGDFGGGGGGNNDGNSVAVVVPACEGSPWKASEDLVGSCQGSLKPHPLPAEAAKTGDDHRAVSVRLCAEGCCADGDCVAWQYREDTGCLHGGDIRLGMEKDGPGSWCHDHPPMRWEGQRILPKTTTTTTNGDDKESADACHADRWNPAEQPGQCFGLGDRRETVAGNTAAACRDACCHDDPDCFAWQFHPALGCFYNRGMHGCTEITDPVVLEPFVGRRKFRPGDRTYTGPDGEPWSQQQLQQQQQQRS